MPIDIGPQYPKDSSFTARMRFHQSWYRARVLNVPYGPGPTRTSKQCYGNMLTEQDGQKGLNFLSPQIFRVANQRLEDPSGTIDRFRLLSNMLSSQPMCFNLFGPLVEDHELATQFFQAVYPEDVSEVIKVKFEYAPTPASEYLNDRTAFDAFIEYFDRNGDLAFIGIETKLVEPFSIKEYENEKYGKWTNSDFSPWPADSIKHLQKVEVNQLWRDHLLGLALRHHPRSLYKAYHFLVVYHPEDTACSKSLDLYSALLKPQDHSFKPIALDQLIQCWKQLPAGEEVTAWLHAFSKRYLDFSESEGEFNSRQ